MSLRRLLSLRPLWVAVVAVALVVSVTGCATSSYSSVKQKPGGPLVGHEVADSENDGTYIQAGGMTYQLQISRQLNPYAVEDSQYIKGLPAGTTAPTGTQLWYGVFLWAKNQLHHADATANNFEIVDTQGNRYYPVKLDASVNPFAWTSETLTPGATEPGQDTVAAQAFTQGKLLLFKLNNSVYDNRPLTLYLLGANGQKIGSISLDS